MKKYVIIAPHADDEIIGCHELLYSGMVETVLFSDEEDLFDALRSIDNFGFSAKLIENWNFSLHSANMIYLFPDPVYETHPDHRGLGFIGEALLRTGQEVIFYTTNMLAPYIHEVSQPHTKRNCLDNLYPTKKDLWKYEHKYFLFEGYTQWIMNFNHE